jgi:hypothetical protein
LGGENEGRGGILEVSRIFEGFLWDNAGLRILGLRGIILRVVGIKI